MSPLGPLQYKLMNSGLKKKKKAPFSFKKEKGSFPSDVGRVGVRTTRSKEHLGAGRKTEAGRSAPAPGRKAGQLLGLPAGPTEGVHFRQIQAPHQLLPSPNPSRVTVGTHPTTMNSGFSHPKLREDERRFTECTLTEHLPREAVRRGVSAGGTARSAPARSSLHMSCVQWGRW